MGADQSKTVHKTGTSLADLNNNLVRTQLTVLKQRFNANVVNWSVHQSLRLDEECSNTRIQLLSLTPLILNPTHTHPDNVFSQTLSNHISPLLATVDALLSNSDPVQSGLTSHDAIADYDTATPHPSTSGLASNIWRESASATIPPAQQSCKDRLDLTSKYLVLHALIAKLMKAATQAIKLKHRYTYLSTRISKHKKTMTTVEFNRINSQVIDTPVMLNRLVEKIDRAKDVYVWLYKEFRLLSCLHAANEGIRVLNGVKNNMTGKPGYQYPASLSLGHHNHVVANNPPTLPSSPALAFSMSNGASSPVNNHSTSSSNLTGKKTGTPAVEQYECVHSYIAELEKRQRLLDLAAQANEREALYYCYPATTDYIATLQEHQVRSMSSRLSYLLHLNFPPYTVKPSLMKNAVKNMTLRLSTLSSAITTLQQENVRLYKQMGNENAIIQNNVQINALLSQAETEKKAIREIFSIISPNLAKYLYGVLESECVTSSSSDAHLLFRELETVEKVGQSIWPNLIIEGKRNNNIISSPINEKMKEEPKNGEIKNPKDFSIIAGVHSGVQLSATVVDDENDEEISRGDEKYSNNKNSNTRTQNQPTILSVENNPPYPHNQINPPPSPSSAHTPDTEGSNDLNPALEEEKENIDSTIPHPQNLAIHAKRFDLGLPKASVITIPTRLIENRKANGGNNNNTRPARPTRAASMIDCNAHKEIRIPKAEVGKSSNANVESSPPSHPSASPVLIPDYNTLIRKSIQGTPPQLSPVPRRYSGIYKPVVSKNLSSEFGKVEENAGSNSQQESLINSEEDNRKIDPTGTISSDSNIASSTPELVNNLQENVIIPMKQLSENSNETGGQSGDCNISVDDKNIKQTADKVILTDIGSSENINPNAKPKNTIDNSSISNKWDVTQIRDTTDYETRLGTTSAAALPKTVEVASSTTVSARDSGVNIPPSGRSFHRATSPTLSIGVNVPVSVIQPIRHSPNKADSSKPRTLPTTLLPASTSAGSVRSSTKDKEKESIASQIIAKLAGNQNTVNESIKNDISNNNNGQSSQKNDEDIATNGQKKKRLVYV